MQLEVGCVHIPRFFAKQNSNFTKAFLMMITLLLLNVGCQEIKNTSKGKSECIFYTMITMIKNLSIWCVICRILTLSVVLPLAHVLLTSFDMEFCTKAASETTLGDALVLPTAEARVDLMWSWCLCISSDEHDQDHHHQRIIICRFRSTESHIVEN